MSMLYCCCLCYLVHLTLADLSSRVQFSRRFWNVSDDASQSWQLFNCLQVDRLGDAKQQVRDAVAAALQAILSSWGLQTVLPMLTSAWAHRNPRVKQGTLQVVTDAITVMPVALSLPAIWMQLVLQPAAKLLDDPNRCRAVSPDIPFCLMMCTSYCQACWHIAHAAD